MASKLGEGEPWQDPGGFPRTQNKFFPPPNFPPPPAHFWKDHVRVDGFVVGSGDTPGAHMLARSASSRLLSLSNSRPVMSKSMPCLPGPRQIQPSSLLSSETGNSHRLPTSNCLGLVAILAKGWCTKVGLDHFRPLLRNLLAYNKFGQFFLASLHSGIE